MTSKTLNSLAIAIRDAHGRLKEMNLGRNSFNDKGGVRLGNALKDNTSLVKLNLSDNNFRDDTALAINKSLEENKSIEEVNLSRNLINIRTVALLEAKCAKNKEVKALAEMPKQAKIKREYRGDRLDAARTAEELDGAFFKHKKLHRQRDKIAVEFDRSRMQEEIHEQNFDE